MSKVLGVNIAGRSYGQAAAHSVRWALNGESRTVVFANVHVVMEAYDDRRFRAELNAMDLVNPDGMPLVWALRALGATPVSRVYGPDATKEVLRAAEEAGISVGFYGGTEATLAKLVTVVRQSYPKLKINFAMSPPFRAPTQAEDDEIVRQIVQTGVRILFVGLGCPKQERWLTAHKGLVPAVMLGVGAAFDFLAGTKPQAPAWMMRSGLEWLFRLGSEPQRLLGRYLKHNPRFVFLFLLQLLRRGGSPKPTAHTFPTR